MLGHRRCYIMRMNKDSVYQPGKGRALFRPRSDTRVRENASIHVSSGTGRQGRYRYASSGSAGTASDVSQSMCCRTFITVVYQ